MRRLEAASQGLLKVPRAQKVPCHLATFRETWPGLTDSPLLCRAVVGQKPPTAPALLSPSPLPQLKEGSDNDIVVLPASMEVCCRAPASLLVSHYHGEEGPPKPITLMGRIHKSKVASPTKGH
jgi:hypothetical protein